MYLNFLNQVNTSTISSFQRAKDQSRLHSLKELEKVHQKLHKVIRNLIIQSERDKVDELIQSQATSLNNCPEVKVKSEYPIVFLAVVPNEMEEVATSLESNLLLEMIKLLFECSKIVLKEYYLIALKYMHIRI
ncbi:unnamed protein product [Ilex paraguariensis]|uniref:Uncharacterized protein n=1 Tax=Ilex paraguariensis TaxID=185542 RepID=A0ABC8SRT2_9AQUA